MARGSVRPLLGIANVVGEAGPAGVPLELYRVVNAV